MNLLDLITDTHAMSDSIEQAIDPCKCERLTPDQRALYKRHIASVPPSGRCACHQGKDE